LREFSFIHTSDIHLGHQQFNLEERFKDFGRAFKAVVDFALEKKVDFVIIGGDFFHKRAINAETLQQSIVLLQPLKNANIPVVAIEGNHDKAFYQDRSSWMKLLNSLGYLKLLKPEYHDGLIKLTSFTLGAEGCITFEAGVRIIGLGYLGSTTEQKIEVVYEQLEPSEEFTIMLLHAAVNRFLAQDLGGVKREVLEKFRSKVDYLALGHIHFREEDDWIFNPGSLENCHIDEAREGREKGFYYVRVINKQKEITYVPGNPRPVKLISIDITGVENQEEAYIKVWQAVEDHKLGSLDRPMVQISLKGSTDFFTIAIDTVALAKRIKDENNCLYVEIQNNTNVILFDDESGLSESSSRVSIEKQVFGRLLIQRNPELKEYSEEIVNLIIRLKEASQTGETPDDIIGQVAKVAEGMLGGNSLEDS
jgi:exonuclease SbcD